MTAPQPADDKAAEHKASGEKAAKGKAAPRRRPPPPPPAPPKADPLARALYNCLISPNVSDSNGEEANIVDALDRLGSAIFALSDSIDRQVASQNGKDST